MGAAPLLFSFLTECSQQKTKNWGLVSGDLFGVLSCTYGGEHIKRQWETRTYFSKVSNVLE